jgi:hypothetical protein
VLDGVLHQLGEHQRQRRRDLRRQQPGRALPDDPDGALRSGHLGAHRQHGVGDAVEGHRLVGRLREHLVHHRDGRDPAHRLLQRRAGLRRVEAPGLQPQQGGHRLQVVLHPVVDLADGGVLAQDLPVAAAQLADVAHQHQRPARLPARHQRQGPQQHGGPLCLDLALARLAEAQHGGQRRGPARLVQDARPGGEPGDGVPQVGAQQVGRHAEAPERRQAVGAGVDDVAGPVQPHQPVADPRGVLRLGHRPGTGSSPR